MLDSQVSPVPPLDLDQLPPGALLTTADLAQATGFSVPTLKRWQRVGKGPRITRVEGLPRFTVRDVKAWIEGTPDA